MPFVAVNCGALPENLIESELFGHRKGAFTGADEHRVGLFEVADGGTIFLDEIGELPKAMQAKLLRFLESGEIRRVGDNESFTWSTCAWSAPRTAIWKRWSPRANFREDLLFRINTFEIRLPPLRRADRRHSGAGPASGRAVSPARCAPPTTLFTPDALRALEAHAWPGNVRELANVIEHAAILCDEGPISAAHLPMNFGHRRLQGPHFKTIAPQTLQEIEMQAIQQTLERHQGQKPKAAKELGISLKTLYNKLNQASQLEESA